MKGGIIPVLLTFIIRIFVKIIQLIIISAIWITICCYIPLKRLNDYYCKNIFPLAVARNPNYFYVQYTNSTQLLDVEELAKAEVIDSHTFIRLQKAQFLIGRYKEINFETAPITLMYGNRRELNGSIAAFTGLIGLFDSEDFVQVSCNMGDDDFFGCLLIKRALDTKKMISLNTGRKGVISVPKEQLITKEQLMMLEQLLRQISQQVHTYFYIVFSQGRVYFISDDKSDMIRLPLWRSIEQEIKVVEKNGITNINVFIDTLINVTDRCMNHSQTKFQHDN